MRVARIRPEDAKPQWILLGGPALYEFFNLHCALSSADWHARDPRQVSYLYALNEDGSIGEWVYTGQKELAR